MYPVVPFWYVLEYTEAVPDSNYKSNPDHDILKESDKECYRVEQAANFISYDTCPISILRLARRLL